MRRRWTRPLDARLDDPVELLGAKAHGLVALHRLGLPVPPGFVVTTAACRAFLDRGRLPDGLRAELAAAVGELEAATGRRFGGVPPLAVSVRSGASVPMPGMMHTVLNLGLTRRATAALAAEHRDERFALDSRLRLLSTFASALTGLPAPGPGTAAECGAAATAADLARTVAAVEHDVERRYGRAIPDDAAEQLALAVEAVLASWNTPRARTYREIHGIDHGLGTAVIVQAMVFGNRDERSGTGVAFSRNPDTGENTPFGDVLFTRQGEDVVSGRSRPLPLRELGAREPAVWAALLDALRRVERHYRDACYLEFTFQSGRLWLLQARPGRFVGAAAVRLATDLADEGVITRREALLRVSPEQLRHARTPRIAPSAETSVLARGTGASPGVAVGRVATTADAAIRMAAEGPVVLVRPETSPDDMNGLAAAAGVVTARGGAASHAAVVARAMGRPAVVGVGGLLVDPARAAIHVAGRTIEEGTVVAVDGSSGQVVLGRPLIVTDGVEAPLRQLLAWADEVSGGPSDLDEVQRLEAARAVLRGQQSD